MSQMIRRLLPVLVLGLLVMVTAGGFPVMAHDIPKTPQGCTPGFWKNHLEHWAATGYSPGQTVGSVFAVPYPSLAGATLLAALSFGGGPGAEGAAQVLLRAAVAALLNEAHPDVNYSLAGVIGLTNAALASGDRNTMLALAGQFDAFNNIGCPLR